MTTMTMCLGLLMTACAAQELASGPDGGATAGSDAGSGDAGAGSDAGARGVGHCGCLDGVLKGNYWTGSVFETCPRLPGGAFGGACVPNSRPGDCSIDVGDPKRKVSVGVVCTTAP